MTDKIVIPKSNIKKSMNLATQAAFDSAVSDIVNATETLKSGKAALVDEVIEFLTDLQGVLALELTFADKELLKDTVVAAYTKKMPKEEKKAKDLATKQWSDVKAVLVKKHKIVFLDKGTKESVKKADTREAEKQQVAIINEIKKNNPKLTTVQAVEDHSKNVKALTSKALTDSVKKTLAKKVDDSEYQLTEKRDSLKNIVACLKFPVNDSYRTDQLKKVDLKKLIKLEKSIKDLLGS
jgi:hypothetical protein